MLLAIDLGNSNTVFGVYNASTLVKSWRVSNQSTRTVDEFGILLRNLLAIEGVDSSSLETVIIASVVPSLDPVLDEMVRVYFSIRPVFVSCKNVGIPVLYHAPEEVGADRLVDAVAVIEKYGSPAIVVDLGTATTFDAITQKGEYWGGLIAPGVEVSARALTEKAALLPHVEIKKPSEVVGRSTEESLQSGFFWGYVSLVDGIIGKLKAVLGDDAHVVATGGMAHFIEGESEWISRVDLDLTLDGLCLVAKKLGMT